jgi:hypothetical protein
MCSNGHELVMKFLDAASTCLFKTLNLCAPRERMAEFGLEPRRELVLCRAGVGLYL